MLGLIFVGILTLAAAGIVLLYRRQQDFDLTGIATTVQAIATVVLVVVTWIYVVEVKESRKSQESASAAYIGQAERARISQESASTAYIEQAERTRRQQLRPYVYPVFYWRHDISKFMAVLQNVGPGPVFDIEYSYAVVDDNGKEISHQEKCPVLAAGAETADMTPFAGEHMDLKNEVTVKVTYKDLFGESFSGEFRHNLRQLANNPPPTEHSERIARALREASLAEPPSSIKEGRFLEALQAIRVELQGIKEQIQRRQ
jgi:energy-converting hydrogenase Eha subunit C